MYEVTKKFTFSSGHRLSDYKGDCARVHGHNYTCEVTVRSKQLDPKGMVIDFGILKTLAKVLNDKFDHRLILKKGDSYNENLTKLLSDDICWVGYNPTAENMAKDILDIFQRELSFLEKLKVVKIRLYETSTSFAEVFAI